jgi:GMP synthase (glutamine-hydrolysing)
MPEFNALSFVEEQVQKLRETVGNERVLAAVSGGVDSTTAAVLARKAIGSNVVSLFMDTGFMRINEPESIIKTLSSLPIPLNVEAVDARKRFLTRMKGIPDAEKKRKVFRAAFYEVLSDEARRRGCSFLLQGTIAPDWIETRGGIKTQHNVLSQIGINPEKRYGFKVLEPLADLYKFQVREVARVLGIREELFRRQPFPGPGLSVRVVGAISRRKLEALKKADLVVRRCLDSMGCDQYFAVILDGGTRKNRATKTAEIEAMSSLGGYVDKVTADLLLNRATGMEEGARRYGKVLAIALSRKGELIVPSVKEAVQAQDAIVKKLPGVCHVLVETARSRRRAPYVAAIRAVQTKDFMTASVSELDPTLLVNVSQTILNECPEISRTYYDVTPKPPATIEFE